MVLDDLETAAANIKSCKCKFAKKYDKWIDDYFVLENITNKADQKTFRQMLDKVMVDTIYCSISFDGKTVACGSAAIEHGYALIQNIIVDEKVRGKGFGKQLVASLLKKAFEMGAQHSYLQVVQTNTVALNLYKQFGFKKEYSYWYMKK